MTYMGLLRFDQNCRSPSPQGGCRGEDGHPLQPTRLSGQLFLQPPHLLVLVHRHPVLVSRQQRPEVNLQVQMEVQVQVQVWRKGAWEKGAPRHQALVQRPAT